MESSRLTARELAELSGVKLSTLNAFLQGARGKRGIPSEYAIPIAKALGLTEAQLAQATGAFSVGRSFTIDPGKTGMLREAIEAATASWGQKHELLPTSVRLRENEIERELIEAGASEQQVRDFRKSVRESPLIAALFRGGAPDRQVAEAEMQLYEGIAIGFKAIVEQMIKEEREAKRRR